MNDVSADHRNKDISIIFSFFLGRSNVYAISEEIYGGLKHCKETANIHKKNKEP